MALSPAEALLAVVRRNSRPGTWSSAVTLHRSGAVALESREAEEVVYRVRVPGRPVAVTVVLYPGEREWDCDCGGRVSPCEHVAAAAIALAGPAEESGGAAEAPAPAASTASWGRVLYRFSRADGGLRLRRFIAAGDGPETPLAGTLSALLAQPGRAGMVQPEQHDLRADLLLEAGAGNVLPPSKLDALLKVLVGARTVLLDGTPVLIVEEEVLPQAVIEDQGDEVVVAIQRDPRVVEVVSPAVALCNDGSLARLGETELAGGWLQNLPIRNRYRATERAELVTRVLPDLSRRMAVDVRSRGLPPVVRDLEPRVAIDLKQMEAGTLSVLPTLVYGSPPCVRIDDGKMVHLRGPVPVRAVDRERQLVERLRSELNLMPGRRARFDGADVPLFVGKLRRWRGTLTGDAAGIVGTKLRLQPRLRVEGAGEAVRFELKFEVSEAGGPTETGRFVDAAAVVRAWQEGLGLCPLDGGGWAPLPMEWLSRHGQRVAELLAAREADGRLATHALPALGLLCDDLNQPPPPSLQRLVPLLAGWEQLPAAPLPPTFTGTLRPYQQRGVDWLTFLRRASLGGILADDMGLGKTVQTLAVVGAGQKTLVVCPTSVFPNWQAELARFRPDLRVCAYHGAGRTLDPAAEVVLTTYALLRLDAEKLTPRRWNLLVVDEAQTIKNPDSQIARAAYALEADTRIALSGTPVENRLDELWSLMHFCNRGLLGGRRDFEDRFARPIAEGSGDAGEELRRKIKPFVLRRHKRDVAPELPPRTESVLRVALDDRERELYDSVRAATQADLVALLQGGGGVMKALEALLRLRQAACHPALLPGQEARTSSKLERLAEALEMAALEGHKALVFSQWTSLLDLIEPRLTAAGLSFVRLDGATRDRAEVVTRFQSDEGPPVMLISLKAGGVGLNLTAADHVFLCDPWWNPAVEAQAADRAHRIGQDKPVMVYRLVATGTVEERILALQEHKRALFDAALGDAGAATGLTRDDLMQLLA